MDTALEIRPLVENDTGAARVLIKQLRPHLDDAAFFALLQSQGENAGYAMVGAWAQTVLVGVIGYRWTENFVRGLYLYIDDLVVEAGWRKRGVGQALLAHAEALAQARGVTTIFLISAPDAEPFYERVGYRPHTARLFRKMLEETNGLAAL